MELDVTVNRAEYFAHGRARRAIASKLAKRVPYTAVAKAVEAQAALDRAKEDYEAAISEAAEMGLD